MGQGFRSGLAGLGLRVSHEVLVNMSAGAASSEDLTGAGGSFPGGALTCCWLEASVPHRRTVLVFL